MRGALTVLAAGLTVLAAGLAGCGGAGSVARLPRWQVVEELRIGGAESGPTSLSDIRGLAVDDAGRIFVLDFQSQQIQLFDSTGTHVRAIGRQGQGPGEFGNANGLLRAPDGRVWVNDPSNNRFTVLDPEGRLVASHRVQMSGYGYLWQAWFSPTGVLHEVVLVRRDTSWAARVRRFTGESLRVDTLPVYPCDLSSDSDREIYRTPRGMMQVPFVSTGHSATDPRGYMWCSSTRGDRIARVNLQVPETTAVVTSTSPPAPVTSAQRDTAAAQVRDFFQKTGGGKPDLSKIPAVKPAVLALDVDDTGCLWVRPGTTENGTVFDVYDSAGRPVAEARAAFAIAPYRPVLVRGDHLYTVVSDPDGVPYVVRGRIARR